MFSVQQLNTEHFKLNFNIMPFFTVIIPTYNRAGLLRSAVESVLRQTFTDFEVMVVDDGSTDSTPAVLAEWGGRVKGLRQENCGAAAARNRGIETASGTYCVFLDSDDLWFPWTLEMYRKAIEQAGEPAGLISTPLHFDDQAGLASVSPGALRVDRYADYLQIADLEMYRGSGVSAWKTTALREAGGFVEERVYGEDIDLFLRLGIEPGLGACCRARRAWRFVGMRAGAFGNLDWNVRGVKMLIRRERAGEYPGGSARQAQRLSCILSHSIVISLWCIEQRRFALGLGIYFRMFDWLVGPAAI